jgi:hypothetical protein
VLRKISYRLRLRRNRSQGKVILHIGKTGGTALKEVLGSVPSEHYGIELHEHDFRLRDVPNGDKAVFFVRDPVSRFVSGFNSRKRQSQPRNFYPWSPEEMKAFKRFETPNELATALSSKERCRRIAAVRAMKSINHVNSCYWNWFESPTYFLSRLSDILLIGHQETMESDFTLLKRALNLPKSLELPKDPIRAHRGPAGLDVNLDTDALRNLEHWYASDYEFLELCKQWRGQNA